MKAAANQKTQDSMMKLLFCPVLFAPSISTKFHCCTGQQISPKWNQTLHFALFLLPTQPHWVNHLTVGFGNHIHHRGFLLLTTLVSQRLSARESKQCLRPILDPSDPSREHAKLSALPYWKGPGIISCFSVYSNQNTRTKCTQHADAAYLFYSFTFPSLFLWNSKHTAISHDLSDADYQFKGDTPETKAKNPNNLKRNTYCWSQPNLPALSKYKCLTSKCVSELTLTHH